MRIILLPDDCEVYQFFMIYSKNVIIIRWYWRSRYYYHPVIAIIVKVKILLSSDDSGDSKGKDIIITQ